MTERIRLSYKSTPNSVKYVFLFASILFLSFQDGLAQGTQLLRNPDLSDSHIVFSHGGDLWTTTLDGGNATRLTSTQAAERNPVFSPDGKWIAFTSNRSGSSDVYLVPSTGGAPTRLTFHPSQAVVRGWTPDGKSVLYSSTRDTAPSSYHRLWTVPVGGGSSTLLMEQWSFSGSYSSNGEMMVIDKMSRWDSEFRDYRGGQNTPLIILNLSDWTETMIPSESTTEINPIWLDDQVYFLSDRDGTSNIWAYEVSGGALAQVTKFTDSDVKTLSGNGGQLIYERDGLLHLLDRSSGSSKTLTINVVGDFPWAETRWEDVSGSVRWSEISPTGKRAIMESRGEIFTVPVKDGDTRNISQSSGTADRAPIWSPNGDEIAWFTDKGGKGYALTIMAQDGLGDERSISLGESKMAWEPSWSPDGEHIAFVDDDVRIRVVNVESGDIVTADVGGTNLERGRTGLTWSPDSKWLTYSKAASNSFRQVVVWNAASKETRTLTDKFADSFSPVFDRDMRHLYFLASTDLALASGWANTSSMTAAPEYDAYVINLRSEDESPFKPKSDEEETKESDEDEETGDDAGETEEEDEKDEGLLIDFDRIERRTMAIDMPTRNYQGMLAGPSGSVFVYERVPNSRGSLVHKFVLSDNEANEYLSGVGSMSVSADGNKALISANGRWMISDTSSGSGDGGEKLNVDLSMKLDRGQEWSQMFEEAWRYERDYFYDPNMHGRDWDLVYERYAPLIPHIKHRTDLSYVLDMINGELSVGHSFVFGGDFPDVESQSIGLLGADLEAENGRWKITRIYTTETWNPNLSSPLDRPGMKIEEGNYIVGINGNELTSDDNPFEFLDGTLGKQTRLAINDAASYDEHWTEIVTPIRNENALRQRAWVEDNRRRVDELSGGRLAYIWVPNTGGGGFVSFNRYYFAQQDKEGAVLDERFNGGGLLDDYMVDLMNRRLRASITNEVPGGKPLNLPAGILGPKVLLINELAGSGGDFFPWVFRQQKTGPLIGMRTWGGLVKSSVHYSLVDGGALTAPDNAVFDPATGEWIAENFGVAPDIEVRQDALSLSQGGDPQLERAVQEALKLLEAEPKIEVKNPAYPSPAKN